MTIIFHTSNEEYLVLNKASISVSAATLASCCAEAGFRGKGGSLKLSLDATLSLFCFKAALSRFLALGIGLGIPRTMYEACHRVCLTFWRGHHNLGLSAYRKYRVLPLVVGSWAALPLKIAVSIFN